jgi:hypothetical protein
MNRLRHLRILLIILAVVVILVPTMIVGITGNGLGETTSHLLISASIAFLIATTLLGLDRGSKNKFFTKIGVSIGLLIVLVSVWL